MSSKKREAPATSGNEKKASRSAAATTPSAGSLKRTKTVVPFKCVQCGEKSEDEDGLGTSICNYCGEDFGCVECSMDDGGWCGDCKEFTCFQCPGHPSACDECLEYLCEDCGDFKPGKNRTQRCHSCQPWWQQYKPASAFCRDCGSQRQGAGFCEGCYARICEECSYTHCTRCHDLFFCDECKSNDDWCLQCLDENSEDCCVDCCEGHDGSSDDEEEESKEE